MPAKIIDQFANLNVSRQRKYQMRKHAQSRCVICAEPAVTSHYCLRHAIYARESGRNRVGAKLRINSKTYRLTAESNSNSNTQSPIEGVRHVSEVLPNVLSQIVEWHQQRKDLAA